MKIGRHIQFRNTSFSAIPLYRATLLQKSCFRKAKPIEALVSIVEKSDLERLELSPQRWIFTRFGEDIIQEISRMSPPYQKYFKEGGLIVEIPSEKGNNQIKAIASFSINSLELYLNGLQSKSEETLFRRIKGAGSLVMYALSKIAQKDDCLSISLYSAPGSAKFYKKIGLKNIFGKKFALKRTEFRDFQRKLEEKFQIKEVKKQ